MRGLWGVLWVEWMRLGLWEDHALREVRIIAAFTKNSLTDEKLETIFALHGTGVGRTGTFSVLHNSEYSVLRRWFFR